jgi:hypothetical protein
MTDDALILAAEKIVSDLKTLPAYRRYQMAKNALASDTALCQKKKDRETLQKSIRYLSGSKKREALALCQAMEKSYEEEPLVVTEKNAKADLLALLEPLFHTAL